MAKEFFEAIIASGGFAGEHFDIAAGLFAAIPAVVAYNYFLNKVRMLSSQMESFSAEFLNIVERHFRSL